MIGNYLLRSKSSGAKMATVVGLSALAGVALLYAIPQTRKTCSRWISDTFNSLKERMGASNNNGSWRKDLAHAERLKGPIEKRKNASQINVSSAGTTAWKDDWSSE